MFPAPVAVGLVLIVFGRYRDNEFVLERLLALALGQQSSHSAKEGVVRYDDLVRNLKTVQ